MKKSLKDYIEIALTLAIIAGLFMPYADDIIPIDFMFEESNDFFDLFFLAIPLLCSFPLLLILMFKSKLKNAMLKTLNALFLLVYLIVLGLYSYELYESFGSSYFSFIGGSIEFSATIILSLVLLLLSLKYAIAKSDELQNILLAIMAFPIILFFVDGVTFYFEGLNYGGYIINISFISLYMMAIYTIIKNRKIKNSSKKEKTIA